MPNKPYNDIFERLTKGVSGEERLVGMLAYALYKQGKAEVCEQARQNGTPLTAEDLANYHASFGATAQDAFETKARQALIAFANEYLEAQKPKIIEEAVGSLAEVIAVRTAQLESKIASSTSFWRGFWPGFAASAAFFVIAAVIALAWAAENSDTMRKFLHGTQTTAENALPKSLYLRH